MSLPAQATKLIDYALCPSAGIGEATTAITAALPLIRAAGITSASRLAESIGLPVKFTPPPAAPANDAIFPFGKHVGEYVKHVWANDRKYCLWFRENVEIDGDRADEIGECHDAIDALRARAKGGRG